MWLHEGHIAAIKNFPELLFTSQWQLFDIAVSSRREGYTICLDGESTYEDNNLKYLNNKGLVERDHKTKKDPFYLYKAWWNQTDKFVHICGKDYEKLNGRAIKCYTNDGDKLTLFVNNVEIQTVTVENNIATFTARDFNQSDVIRVNGATTHDAFTLTNDFITDGNWNEAANWRANEVPADGTDVVIRAECTIPNGVVIQTNITTIGENGQLGKFYFGTQNANIYIPQNGKEYAIAFSNCQDDIPLNFKTAETGIYTISFEGEEMYLNSIYLIDMLTGQEIDLSFNPSYTFLGSAADRSERFKIVFKTGFENAPSDIFAYQNGNDIVVSGEGELQIFDVMGRLVSTHHISGVERFNVKTQGVYIFKLNDKTQKIVIR